MGKELSEMTLAELWQLFPIVLTAPRAEWAEWYAAEVARLRSLLPSDGCRISHIGSTSLQTIWAKPIVDILYEIPPEVSVATVMAQLESSGYLCMHQEATRADFNRGYTKDGFAARVFHLHLRVLGDNDELYFRDYLTDNPTVAKAYETLKLSLWKKYEHDRDGYTAAKGDFITRYTKQAKSVYAGRYFR